MSQIGKNYHHCPCGKDVLIEVVTTGTERVGDELVVHLGPTADTRIALEAHENHDGSGT